MLRKLSAAPLSYINTDAADWIRACEAAELDFIGLRLSRVGDEYQFPLDVNSREFRELKSLLDDSRIQALDVEVFILHEHTQRDEWLKVLVAAEVLGATYINVLGYDADFGRFEAMVSAMTVDARNHGIVPVLEPVAYRALNSYTEAIRIAKNVSCFVELDGLHFVRTGAALSDIADNPELFPIAQLCDAEAVIPSFGAALRLELGAGPDESDQIVESRYLRTPAGQGIAPWRELLNVLPDTTIVALETPNVLQARTMTVGESMAEQGRVARDFVASLSLHSA
ncbi:MAG: TIM barrel protein [Microbacteriaceae bacterium]